MLSLRLSFIAFFALLFFFFYYIEESPPIRTLLLDPLDLSFWSFLTFLHHGMEEVERYLL